MISSTQRKTRHSSARFGGATPIALAMLLATLFGCGGSQGGPAPKGSVEAKPAPSPPRQLASAQDVLEAMAAAYKRAQSYADSGTVRLVAEVGKKKELDKEKEVDEDKEVQPDKIDEQADFSVTLARPNRFRLHVYQGLEVCDGQKMYGCLLDLPGQVVVKQAPAAATRQAVYADALLAKAMTEGFAGASPQLLLLVEDDALPVLLQGTQQPVLAEPGEIDGRKYYRVQIKRPDGTATFWIDQETFVLRRIVFPTEAFHQWLSQQGTVKSLSLVAELTGAQFDGKIDAKAFAFEVPADAEAVKFLVPSHPAQVLAKQVPEFKFVDLQGNEITPKSLSGKIAVLDFWATWCGPCRQSLPNFEKVYQHYKDDRRIAFVAVSVDRPQVEDKALVETFQELGVHVPIARDSQQQLGRLFRSTGIPSTFVIDAKGIVQDYERGSNPDLAEVLPQKLEKLLAGENIYGKLIEDYQQQLQQYEKALEKAAQAAASGKPPVEDQPIPRATVAPRNGPKNLRLTSLWKCTDLKAPGNLLVASDRDGTEHLWVIEGWRAVAELGLDGKLLGIHPLELNEEAQELAANLRTAIAADGKRYFAALASGQQRFHLYDANWKKLLSYPEDALENKHAGIADVQLADLDSDGVPELYVGYWGDVGVQAVALAGKRMAANRSLTFVLGMAAGEPTAQGQRSLYCVNNTGSLVAMDARLQKQGEVVVPDRPLQWVVAADLGGKGRLEWCGLAVARPGDNIAVGLNLRGDELWNYTLPEGVHQQPIERIISGKLTAAPAGAWLLPGPDGSIHMVAPDGKLIDRFNYGTLLHGLATATIGGKPALLVASPEGVEAWRVE